MNRYKATVILFIVSVGFFVSYPFNNTFWGSLLSSVFCAAMIGGFADWFGVSALFRKPLGIPFKTEIIPRNREKIFNALSDMVGDELLTKDTLNEMINRNNISKLLIKYLSKNEEKKQLEEVAGKIVQDVIWKINPDEAGKMIEGVIKDNIIGIKISSIIAAAVELSIKKGYDNKLINFTVDELIKLSKTEPMTQLIAKLVEKTLNSYKNGMMRRELALRIFLDILLQLSPQDIALIFQKKLIDSLREFKNPESADREKFMKWINEKVVELKSDSKLQKKIEDWKFTQIETMEIHTAITDFIKNIRENNLENSSATTNLTKNTEEQISKLINEFQENIQWQNKLDYKVKGLLSQFIDNNHDKINVMVKENLNKFTNDEIVRLIETKVGNDLQMIRINGSVVGGLVGLITFILTFWI